MHPIVGMLKWLNCYWIMVLKSTCKITDRIVCLDVVHPMNGHTEVAKLLLDHDAQVNMQDNGGWSTLMYTSSKGHTEVAKLLLDHDAQVNMQNNDQTVCLDACI